MRFNWSDNDTLWELLIATRSYAITLFIVAPIIHLFILLGYIQPLGVVILLLGMLLVAKFVLFEPRADSIKFVKISLAFLLTASVAIFINFSIGLVINIAHLNFGGIFVDLCVIIGSIQFFYLVLNYQPFKKINTKLSALKSEWIARGKYIKFKKKIFGFASLCWLLVSIILIFIPYPVYYQSPPSISSLNQRKIGIWTYGTPLDSKYADEKTLRIDYRNWAKINDETLKLFAEKDIYLVYRIRPSMLTEGLVEKLDRCKKYGVEVHVAFTPQKTDIEFVNIWTFETLMGEIDEVLNFMASHGYLDGFITTIVYDMEGDGEKHFPDYGFDPNVTAKLSDYYNVKAKFQEFNQHINDDYGLEVRICSDMYQGLDVKDGDDDIISLWGLLSDPNASMSYMVYTRDNLGLNYVLDHCRYLNDNDTILLNSWKLYGYHCWNDLDCAIKECRLVLSYPGKNLNVEIWALHYFLRSYGILGLHEIIEALTEDPQNWAEIDVWNQFWYSTLSDLIIIGTSLLDLYGPIFRIALGAV